MGIFKKEKVFEPGGVSGLYFFVITETEWICEAVNQTGTKSTSSLFFLQTETGTDREDVCRLPPLPFPELLTFKEVVHV